MVASIGHDHVRDEIVIVIAIVRFLRDIGLAVMYGPTNTGTVLPGIAIRSGGLVVDRSKLAAIAWSYAAVVHLGVDPSIVFHSEGYRGWSRSLLDNFVAGRFLAVANEQHPV